MYVSVTLATVVVSGVPAMADERPSGGTAAVDESVLHLPSDVIKAAADDPATATERSAAGDKFVANQARSGRLVDLAFTNAAVVNGVATVWEHGVILNSVKVTTAAESDSGKVVAHAFEVVGSADPSAEDISQTSGATVADEMAADDGVATGLGLAGLQSPKGGKLVSKYCTETSKSGNLLTSCFEKFKIKESTKTRDFYYYNRWATAAGEEDCALCFDSRPARIDIQSRPWSGSEGFATVVDYFPMTGKETCKDKSFELEALGFGGKIPIQNCEDVNPEPGERSMRVIYDMGTAASGRVKGVDMGFAYGTFKGENPDIADYSYAKFCDPTVVATDCVAVIRQDEGW